jgi:hypothetical protein
MDVLHGCCAGLDVHKRTVVATVRRVDPVGKVSIPGVALRVAEVVLAEVGLEITGRSWEITKRPDQPPGPCVGTVCWGATQRRRRSSSVSSWDSDVSCFQSSSFFR